MLELSEKMERFCVFFGTPGTETYQKREASAIAAGYAEKSAARSAWDNLKKAMVRERIKQIRKKWLEENDITNESVLANIEHERIMSSQEGKRQVAIRCLELEGRWLEMWKDNPQGDVSTPADELSEDELKRLKALSIALRKYESTGVQPDMSKVLAGLEQNKTEKSINEFYEDENDCFPEAVGQEAIS